MSLLTRERISRERIAPRRAREPVRRPAFRGRGVGRRRVRVPRWLAVLLVLALLSGAGWLAIGSSWATVNRIEVRVSGGHRIPPAELESEAVGVLGRPLLLAPTGEIRDRLEAQRLVRSARVLRHWPGVLRLEVTERSPVAAVPGPGGIELVDGDGVVIERTSALPAGMPRIDVDLATEGAPALRACLQVLSGLPAPIARSVRTIGARSPEGVWLTLKGGARVEWGDATGSAAKGQVLTALLSRKAAAYDVRSPRTPAVRER